MADHRSPRRAPLHLGRGTPPPSPVRSVYVHAPFCPRRCFYCDFAVTVSEGGEMEGWLQALSGELALVEEEGLFRLASTLGTLFVGGGTPSVLGPGAMRGLARVLGPGRLRDPVLEWTAEANPESFTREVAEGWALAGVNRISLGAQSFHEGVLRWMGRLHGPPGTAQAVARARAAGITNISLDLIFGLPPSVKRDWDKDLDQAFSLEVPHLSLYGLTVEEGTPLARAVEEGRVPRPEEEQYREEYLQACEKLADQGYLQYEVSNFALPGFEARHNQAYWEPDPYLGLGNGAHSHQHPLRRWNLREWAAYQKALADGLFPGDSEEEIGPREIRLERVWLGLRTDRGISLDGLPPRAVSVMEGWVRTGLAVPQGGGIRLIPKGWVLLDQLAVELDGALDGGFQEPPQGGNNGHGPGG
ncbi:radical SAM family heme chaperone HemW [Gemmatimonadota bacterium]